MPKMTFFGIDPGVRYTGVSAVGAERSGHPELFYSQTITSPRSLTSWEALWHMVDEVRRSIPSTMDQIAIESFDYQGHEINREAHDTYLLVGALGEMRQLAPVTFLRAGRWREELTGLRAYTDRQIEKAIGLRLKCEGLEWASDHEVDATGIAIVAADRFFMAQAALVKQFELRSNSRRVRR